MTRQQKIRLSLPLLVLAVVIALFATSRSGQPAMAAAPFTGDRSMSADIERLAAAIVAGELRAAAQLPSEL